MAIKFAENSEFFSLLESLDKLTGQEVKFHQELEEYSEKYESLIHKLHNAKLTRIDMLQKVILLLDQLKIPINKLNFIKSEYVEQLEKCLEFVEDYKKQMENISENK